MSPTVHARCSRALRSLLQVTALVVVACSHAVAPAASIPPPRIDPALVSGERALAAVRDQVALGPRPSGSSAAEKAAQQIKARLDALGVAAEIDAFTNSTPTGDKVFRNVIGRIAGSATNAIVIGAHYDTKSGIPGFVGANDAGSGTGLLLELARVVKSRGAQGPELELVFFDGEEAQIEYGPNDGFHGSKHHVERLIAEGRASRVTAMILLDMVGDKDLTITVPPSGDAALTTRLLDAARDEGVRERFAIHPYDIMDDHTAFADAGIPAVDLIDFQYGSSPEGNDYWHTAADTVDKLSAGSLATVGRIVVRMLNAISAGGSGLRQ